MSQEGFDLGFSRKEIIVRTHAVEADKPHDPANIGTLGVNRVVMKAQILADLIEVSAALVLDMVSSQAYAFLSKLSPKYD